MDKIKSALVKIKITIQGVLKKIQAKLVRKTGEAAGDEVPEVYLPETTEDLVWVMKKLPENVISKAEKKIIAGAMTFGDKLVREIMTPKAKAVLVHENDFMGPLTLDRLYKSGLKHFPVIDAKGGISGVLHTASLNSLEVRETDRASSYVDPTVYYIRENYTLEEALAAFLRTESQFLVVVSSGAVMTGVLTFSDLMKALLGKVPKDDFCSDTDLMAVAKRGMGGFIRKAPLEERKVEAVDSF